MIAHVTRAVIQHRIFSTPVLALAIFALVVFNLQAEASKKSSATKWVTLNDCRFFSNASNDGDSFHAIYNQREFIFRFYFVDAPETDDDYPDRVREQCKYFGVTREENFKMAEQTKTFLAAALQNKFIVKTRWQNAMGRSKLPRYYAFVEIGGKDLASVLISRGLARAKGTVAILPDGTPAKDHMAKLKKLESEAKEKQIGIWALSAENKVPSMTKPETPLP
ncbi:MAG: thermonuclease family protein [Verrucomicrobiota bacterium]